MEGAEPHGLQACNFFYTTNWKIITWKKDVD